MDNIDIIKTIIKDIKVKPGKTIKEQKDFEENQVWGRDEQFWIIKKIATNQFEYTETIGEKTEFHEYKTDKKLRNYFNLQPYEKTYSEIFDDRIIERLFYKEDKDIEELKKSNTKKLNELSILIDKDFEKFLIQFDEVEKLIEKEKIQTEKKELFSKKAYTNGTNKIFITFYNSEEIYQLKDLSFANDFLTQFNISNDNKEEIDNISLFEEIKQSREKIIKAMYKLDTVDMNKFFNNTVKVYSIDNQHYLLFSPLNQTIKILKKYIKDNNLKPLFKTIDMYKRIYIIKKELLEHILELNKFNLKGFK